MAEKLVRVTELIGFYEEGSIGQEPEDATQDVLVTCPKHGTKVGHYWPAFTLADLLPVLPPNCCYRLTITVQAESVEEHP